MTRDNRSFLVRSAVFYPVAWWCSGVLLIQTFYLNLWIHGGKIQYWCSLVLANNLGLEKCKVYW